MPMDLNVEIAGTKIVYERAFLMQMRHSPLAKSPPANLPSIPGVTTPASGEVMTHSSQQGIDRILVWEIRST
jgi:Eukaryotic translation initiation factor 4E binding protein (EIF4EBP)